MRKQLPQLFAVAIAGVLAFSAYAQEIRLEIPSKPLLVGSFQQIPVSKVGNSAIKFDDLEFFLPEGPAAGVVSTSRDRKFSLGRPSVLLNAGFQPGRHKLIVRKKGTTTVLGEAEFVTTDIWTDARLGPSLWVSGAPTDISPSFAWGGGSSGIQNVPVKPMTGTLGAAILLVDTASQRFTTDATELQAIKDRWKQSVQDGVLVGTELRSVARYYREVSHGLFDIQAEVFGPVHLEGDWDSYFGDSGGVWTPNGTIAQEAITKGDPLIDYGRFPLVVLVSQEVTGPPRKFAWPATWDQTLSTAEKDPLTGKDIHFGIISMSAGWGEAGADEPNREIYETLSHEVGHDLGLADQYGFSGEDSSTAGRHVEGWDIMDLDDPFPYFSIAHRIMLGWIDPTWVKTYNFLLGQVPPAGGDLVSLSPIESLPPPAGLFAGIEVRIGDGLNYYYEFRKAQTTKIGDLSLSADRRVLGTDVMSYSYMTAPYPRRSILLQRSLADGPVLDLGQHYEELDPTAPARLNVKVENLDDSKADVRITYGVNGQADPSIRPWPAGPGREWQSPDIDVRNARNGNGDPSSAWFNVPWTGNANTVVAKVTNRGDRDAPAVTVNFFAQNFTVGGSPEFPLASDTHDVPAGKTVEFSSPWVPAASGHFCVTARIPLYQDPVRKMVEITELNNKAQSNYVRFISSTASPPTREESQVEVRNPFAEPTMVRLIPTQTNPLYRTYVDPVWMQLAGGETRRVSMMFEYAGDDLKQQANQSSDQAEKNRISALLERFQRVPNQVALKATIVDPRAKRHYSLQTLGGLQAQVVTGRATTFARFGANRSSVTGLVVTADNRQTAPAGSIILTLKRRGAGGLPEIFNDTFRVNSGSFERRLPAGWETVEAYYLATPGGIADSESKPAAIPR